jgi:class 3 adenylate cyclase
MLNEYFEATVPMIANEYGGVVDKLIGDAIMVTFNTRGDQPDHALRAPLGQGSPCSERPGAWSATRSGLAFVSASTRAK